jgi:hypothetical protein
VLVLREGRRKKRKKEEEKKKKEKEKGECGGKEMRGFFGF